MVGDNEPYWSARAMSASGAAAERREVYPFQLPFLFEQDKDWIMGRAIVARLSWT